MEEITIGEDEEPSRMMIWRPLLDGEMMLEEEEMMMQSDFEEQMRWKVDKEILCNLMMEPDPQDEFEFEMARREGMPVRYGHSRRRRMDRNGDECTLDTDVHDCTPVDLSQLPLNFRVTYCIGEE